MAQNGTPPPEEARNDRKLRIARLVILGSMSVVLLMVLGLPVFDAVAVATDTAPWRFVAAQAAAIPLAVLLVLLIQGRLDGRRDPDPRVYWASLALTVAGAAALHTPLYSMFLIALWWAVGVFTAKRRLGIPVSLGLAVLPWLLLPLDPTDAPVAVHLVMWVLSVAWALLMASGTMASLWLWDITNDAVRGQAARAQLAVTEERLRFARDMHDLLGHSLSALAVKAELASRLAERAPERAAAEMTEVHELARKALQQVRSAVSGYREIDLAGEVDAVRAVLAANGTRVSVSGLDGLAPAPAPAALAAWVVREGGTNVLRHSEAGECRIAFTPTLDASGQRTLVVEVSNDGVRGNGAGKESSGNGLAGLSERVSMGGGNLSATRTRDGGFLLRAVIPL
ncbi:MULTISPECIES: sensor histidine kinase [unclassified Nocardiopsis]|uniref:sensor histidine kinase n=1 Tax=unclassified Nocardiopsis TaxID=2649073 RepID=UPI001F273F9A|nr:MULTISPECIES: histidine kinase [unclassified Nocardiopsis]